MIEIKGIGKSYPTEKGATEKRPIWILKDLYLRIERGQTVGLSGPNGSGKSTLLKIIGRITAPSEGELTLNGRVGALLEVGTGFHHELTGRENIFLSGAILGMSRRQIKSHFDAIVGFAEISPFLDTPIKRYSSGMLLRLGFSVMAHLDCEILLIDEILSVGDQAFRAKSYAKIHQLSEEGRTLIIASHDDEQIKALCDATIVLSLSEKKERERNSTVKMFDKPRSKIKSV